MSHPHDYRALYADDGAVGFANSFVLMSALRSTTSQEDRARIRRSSSMWRVTFRQTACQGCDQRPHIQVRIRKAMRRTLASCVLQAEDSPNSCCFQCLGTFLWKISATLPTFETLQADKTTILISQWTGVWHPTRHTLDVLRFEHPISSAS